MNSVDIIFIQLHNASFIRKDIELLSKHHRVQVFHFRHTKGIAVIPDLIREFFFLIKHLSKCDIVYVWFADFHAVLPAVLSRIFRKKCIIVIGGVDASFNPVLNYGTKTRLAGAISVHLATSFAHLLLPVTQYTYNSLLKNISKKLQTKAQIIYNCYNSSFILLPQIERTRSVITVCLTSSVNTLFVKGVDFFAEVAKAMPQTHFRVVGVSGEAAEWLRQAKPDNLELIGPISHEKLNEYYCASKVICQFSRQEAFGVALLEGIASGCYPVGYNCGGTAEILTEDNGRLIQELAITEATVAVSKALQNSEIEIEMIQEHVLSRFTCQKREDALNNAIFSLLNKS
ncbi:MAG: hypothetical protein CVT92_07340 [Bacteroidetes bacterium HGW-Bacteroidetes-1]|jgi:glycosyltransferase involved in cell wall biosynthesis|nr:MAG: hypothetical protein CVT92_07340 [Bacteroidetes bacterium HGW-Bacteroidetes-1]